MTSSYRPAGVLPRSIAAFIKTETGVGIVTIAFTVLALVAANSPLAGLYKSWVSWPLTFGWGDSFVSAPLKTWVKDIPMVLFFLVVGMELKREMREGVLAKRESILLPLAAALGGMTFPAVIFLSLNVGDAAGANGWAIPSATDIAFALAILGLVGRGVPASVKVFLLAVAIFDDLGAILVIAVFYNQSLALMPLLLALAGLCVLVLLNRRGVATVTPYMLVGIFLWFALYHCGVHTTLAGVAVGLALPMRDPHHADHSPLCSAMHVLHPWVGFIVLPLFAFTSAGISFKGMGLADFLQAVPLGVALGLFLGKQAGILGITWLMVRLGWVEKPEGASWMQLYGVAVLAGIGFTMSLFIGLLAFDDPALQDLAKAGVIAGSALSAAWGALVLGIAARNPRG